MDGFYGIFIALHLFYTFLLHKCSAHSLHVVLTLQLHATQKFPHTNSHIHTRTVTETEHVTITTTTKKLLSAKHTHTPSLCLSILFSRSLAHHVRCCFWLGKRNKIFFSFLINLRIFFIVINACLHLVSTFLYK